MLPGWTYCGRNDFDRSHGAIVQLTHDTWLRIFFINDQGTGGIVEKKFDATSRQFLYQCIINNKTAEQLNDFINLTFNEQTSK